MFRTLTVRGARGAIVWEYHTAAALRTWTVTREALPPAGLGRWRLMATIERVDRFHLLQRPLRFTAPRSDGGRWCWPVKEIQVGERTIAANLDPPEQ